VSSLDFSWQRILTVKIFQLQALTSSVHKLPYRIDLVNLVFFLIIPRHGPRRNTAFPTVPLLLRVYSLLRERTYQAVTQKRQWYIRPYHGRCIAIALHTTILTRVLERYSYYYGPPYCLLSRGKHASYYVPLYKTELTMFLFVRHWHFCCFQSYFLC
jgi:hypothetical protein